MGRRLVLACCALLCCGGVLSAQAGRRAASDPVTGTWTGELRRPGASNPRVLTFALKLDAKGNVTGTLSGMPNPGDVKRGTFDQKTGALKLELGKTDDPAVLLTFEGTVAKDKAVGKLTGEVNADFTLSRQTASSSP